jgi:glycosyltransferase involved in cell wall biosynthesis
MNPKISIIIPTYQRSRLIGEAIRSALNQTVAAHEIIIVDDGSTDDTFTVVNEIAQYYPAVRYIRQDNRGVSVARNTGIKAASGDWLCFLDSDDTLKPYALELLAAQAYASPAPAVIFGRAENVNGSERTSYVSDAKIAAYLADAPSGPIGIFPALIQANVIPMGAVLVDRNVIIPFDADLKLAEDYDLWLELAEKKNRFAYVNAVLVNRRLHAGNVIGQKIAMMEATVKVLSRYDRFEAVLKRLSALRYDLGSAYFRQMRWGKAKEHLAQASGPGLKLAFKRVVAGWMGV